MTNENFDPPQDGGLRSRRRFLRVAVVGGVAAVAAPALARPATATICPSPEAVGGIGLCGARPRPPSPSQPVEVEIGRIRVGAIPQTYVAPPLNAIGSLTWTLSNTRTEVFSMTVVNTAELSASRSLPSFSVGPVTIAPGGSVERRQGRSERVTNAIAISSTETQTIQTSGTGGGFNTIENAAFLMMARPLMSISAMRNPDTGAFGSERFYQFLDAGTIFPRSLRELRDDPVTRNFIGAETADNILAQYPLSGGETSGQRLGLGGPRFGTPGAISPGTTPFSFTRSMSGTTTHIVEQSATSTTRIVESVGFQIGPITFGGYQTGQQFSVTHAAVQENSNTQVISTSGTLTSDRNRLNFVYEDRAWNTILITDEGPLPAGFTAVNGRVFGPNGKPLNPAETRVPAG